MLRKGDDLGTPDSARSGDEPTSFRGYFPLSSASGVLRASIAVGLVEEAGVSEDLRMLLMLSVLETSVTVVGGVLTWPGVIVCGVLGVTRDIRTLPPPADIGVFPPPPPEEEDPNRFLPGVVKPRGRRRSP